MLLFLGEFLVHVTKINKLKLELIIITNSFLFYLHGIAYILIYALICLPF